VAAQGFILIALIAVSKNIRQLKAKNKNNALRKKPNHFVNFIPMKNRKAAKD